nr:PREDICTED: thrombospondin-3 [Struthio camelus australis]
MASEARQMASITHKIRMELLSVNDVYLLSTFRLPPKQGGILFGLYSKKDNARWLEVSVVGKINKVLVRYLREDNKLHSVNLQHAHVADGQSHTVIVRLSGLRGDMLSMELYVDCKQMDSSVGLPELSEIPLAEVEAIEVRTGQKAYQRMQGFVESMKLILGGSMSRVGALSECPFQGDESIHSAGNGAAGTRGLGDDEHLQPRARHPGRPRGLRWDLTAQQLSRPAEDPRWDPLPQRRSPSWDVPEGLGGLKGRRVWRRLCPGGRGASLGLVAQRTVPWDPLPQRRSPSWDVPEGLGGLKGRRVWRRLCPGGRGASLGLVAQRTVQPRSLLA